MTTQELNIWQKCNIKEPTKTPAILKQSLEEMLEKAYDAGHSAGSLEMFYASELDKSKKLSK